MPPKPPHLRPVPSAPETALETVSARALRQAQEARQSGRDALELALAELLESVKQLEPVLALPSLHPGGCDRLIRLCGHVERELIAVKILMDRHR